MTSQFWMYILRCSDVSYYVGHTDDLDKRLAEHQDGSFGGYTARRRPVTLIYTEVFDSRDDAFHRERKSRVGRGRRSRPSRGRTGRSCSALRKPLIPRPPQNERVEAAMNVKPRSLFDKLRVSVEARRSRSRRRE